MSVRARYELWSRPAEEFLRKFCSSLNLDLWFEATWLDELNVAWVACLVHTSGYFFDIVNIFYMCQVSDLFYTTCSLLKIRTILWDVQVKLLLPHVTCWIFPVCPWEMEDKSLCNDGFLCCYFVGIVVWQRIEIWRFHTTLVITYWKSRRDNHIRECEMLYGREVSCYVSHHSSTFI